MTFPPPPVSRSQKFDDLRALQDPPSHFLGFSTGPHCGGAVSATMSMTSVNSERSEAIFSERSKGMSRWKFSERSMGMSPERRRSAFKQATLRSMGSFAFRRSSIGSFKLRMSRPGMRISVAKEYEKQIQESQRRSTISKNGQLKQLESLRKSLNETELRLFESGQPSRSLWRWLQRCSERLRLRAHILLFRAVHVGATLVVFHHFFWIKLRRQQSKVPLDAPNSGWKRTVVRQLL